MRMMPARYQLDVRKNFEEKASHVARRVNGMTVDEQTGLLAVDCGLPSDTFNVIHLLQEACSEDRRLCVLQASKDGLGIYLKAGFSVTGDVLTFERRGVE